MAKAEWLTVSKNTGSGDATISVSASENTGREPRNTTLTFLSKNSTGTTLESVTRDVVQSGKDSFVEFLNREITLEKEGNSELYIEGVSNAAYLQFGFGYGGTLDIGWDNKYIVNDEEVTNGMSPKNDPGRFSQYNFKLRLNVPKNETIETLKRVIEVKPSKGFGDSMMIKVSAEDPFFEVLEDSIRIESSGTSTMITIQSNTFWTIQ